MKPWEKSHVSVISDVYYNYVQEEEVQSITHKADNTGYTGEREWGGGKGGSGGKK